jgi:hypothetical protein
MKGKMIKILSYSQRGRRCAGIYLSLSLSVSLSLSSYASKHGEGGLDTVVVRGT